MWSCVAKARTMQTAVSSALGTVCLPSTVALIPPSRLRVSGSSKLVTAAAPAPQALSLGQLLNFPPAPSVPKWVAVQKATKSPWRYHCSLMSLGGGSHASGMRPLTQKASFFPTWRSLRASLLR